MGRKRQTIMSLLGVMLGVGFFIGVSSMMRGSEKDTIDRITNDFPHVGIHDSFRQARRQPLERIQSGQPEDQRATVFISGVKPPVENRGIVNFRDIANYLRTRDDVQFAMTMETPVMLTVSGQTRSMNLVGIVPEEVRGIIHAADSVIQGRLENLYSDSNGVLAGKAFMDQHKLKMGDTVQIVSGSGVTRVMRIVGVFETGRAWNDRRTLLTLLKNTQVIANRPGRINNFYIKLDDPFLAWDFSVQLEKTFGYAAYSWQENMQDMLNTIATRNRIMYAVVGAILLVACFGIYNIISTVVMEKTKDIAILKSMGFSKLDIINIFLLEGFLVGFTGAILGCGLGRLFLHILSGITIRNPGMTRPMPMPLDYGIGQYFFVSGIAIFSAIIAAYLPARKAGALPPVDILRGAA